MTQYSISDLQKLTGVKTHTIRTWEQRYKLLSPKRKFSNIRYYDNDQLRKLLNISVLLNSGLKISHISKLSNEEIHNKLDEIVENPTIENLFDQALINQMIHAGLTLNEQQFEKAFSSAVLRYNFKMTYLRIIYPLMMKIGLMWGKEKMTAAQEHFVSNLLKQKILSAIDTIPYTQFTEEKWILFLPQDEDHEIGLLFAHYLVKSSGRKVIYLGQRVPFKNLVEVINQTGATHVQSFFTKYTSEKQIQQLLNQLEQLFPKINILVSGNSKMLGELELGKKTEWVTSVEQLQENYLKKDHSLI